MVPATPRPAASPGASRSEPQARRLRRALAWLVLALAVIAGIGYFAYRRSAVNRAVMNLPPEERRALYQRTIQDLQTVCEHREEGLRSYCQEQAEFALKFPECDEACVKLVEKQFPPMPAR